MDLHNGHGNPQDSLSKFYDDDDDEQMMMMMVVVVVVVAAAAAVVVVMSRISRRLFTLQIPSRAYCQHQGDAVLHRQQKTVDEECQESLVLAHCKAHFLLEEFGL